MLEVKNVEKSFGDLKVLNGISLQVNQKDVISIIGPSGSGKTTLLRCINFLTIADSGEMIFDDEHFDMNKVSKKDMARIRKKTAFVFQNYNLFTNKTALENVTEGLIIGRKMPKKEAEERGMKALAKVGMEERYNYYPHQLSGGLRQRVMIGMAMVCEPELLIADEPTGNLDPDTAWEIMQLLDQINKRGTTILMVTHAKDIVDKMGKRVIAIEKGRIVRDEFGLYGYAEALEGVESTFDTIQSARTFRSKSRFRRGGKEE